MNVIGRMSEPDISHVERGIIIGESWISSGKSGTKRAMAGDNCD